MTRMSPSNTAVGLGFTDRRLTEAQVREIVAQALAPLRLAGKKVLLIVPDSTRTAPVGLLFRVIHDLIGADAAALDVMIALGTHPPMTDDAINRRLEITAEERAGKYRRVRVLQPRLERPRRARPRRRHPRERDRRTLRRAVRDGRGRCDQPRRLRLRPARHRRPRVSARSRRIFRRQQVSFSGHRRPGHPQLLPLARRRHHQPEDHRQQGDAGAPRRGPRGRAGARAEVRVLHGRPRRRLGRPVRRDAGSGVVEARRPQRQAAHRL